MDQRTAFLIQVLERIGTPLALAVTSIPVEGTSGSDAIMRQDAQRVAELLNRSVQLGLSMADSMNVRDAARADGVHLALAAFAGPLIAGHFLTGGGRVPNDADVKRLAASLQAVLTFADNFTPAADATMRLDNMDPGDQPADEHVVYVQMLQAFSPVLQVVSEYAFARPESRLLQDISARLVLRAEDLRKAMFGPDLLPRTARQVDLVLLNLVCGLYVTCHRSETMRLMGMDDKTRANTIISMDGVWALFDKRVEMVRLMADQIMPATEGKSGTASAGQKYFMEENPAFRAPLPSAQIFDGVMEKSAGPFSAPPANVPASPSSNPMAFFAPGTKKASDSDQ